MEALTEYVQFCLQFISATLPEATDQLREETLEEVLDGMNLGNTSLSKILPPSHIMHKITSFQSGRASKCTAMSYFMYLKRTSLSDDNNTHFLCLTGLQRQMAT